MRYFISFSYRGTNYHGWQIQPKAISVQEEITKALNTIFRENLSIVGAGRTDAGVHAKQMYAHFDTDIIFDKKTIIKRLNSFLKEDIVIENILEVPEQAHARFDAISRTYEYCLHQNKNAFYQDTSWYFHQHLNIEMMNQAASILLDYQDFQCFSKSHTDVFTYNCNITEAFWQQRNNQLVFTITANRFLRNMVRAVVGTLIDVGTKKIAPEQMHQIIQSKNRSKAGFSVPAHGLFLTKVIYPYL